jgi:hypothetical protein
MLRPLPGPSSPDLERELLRKGVGALSAGRAACAGCGRTPLIGEIVHLYPHDRVVCALCLPGERREPDRSEAVHLSERGQTVRLRPARAA